MTQTAGLTPEMRDMMVQTLRQVVQRDLPDEKLLELDANDEFPADFIQELLSPNVGLHLIFLPESVGGLGGGAMDICVVSEEMAALDLGVATAFLAICLGTDPRAKESLARTHCDRRHGCGVRRNRTSGWQ